ncbi:unnamed protein product [Dicrocoelium dendriticum]|nr:unnamed protein product [Dicrocoelium dendriticum]
MWAVIGWTGNDAVFVLGFSTSQADLSIPDPTIRKRGNIHRIILSFRSQLNLNLPEDTGKLSDPASICSLSNVSLPVSNDLVSNEPSDSVFDSAVSEGEQQRHSISAAMQDAGAPGCGTINGHGTSHYIREVGGPVGI